MSSYFFSSSSPTSNVKAIIVLLCTDIIRQQRLTEALVLAVIRYERTPTCHFKLCCHIFLYLLLACLIPPRLQLKQ